MSHTKQYIGEGMANGMKTETHIYKEQIKLKDIQLNKVRFKKKIQFPNIMIELGKCLLT